MKWRSLILIVCILMCGSITVLAQENYDYREENITDYREFNEICAMEKRILDTFVNSEDTDGAEKVQQLDFSRSVKVLSFNVNDFLTQIKSEEFIEYLANHETYTWRIPVQDRGEKGADYAVAYVNKSGKWTYYTASSENEIGRQQVEYIFEPEQLNQILAVGKIAPDKIYALGISDIGLDCIVIEMDGTVGIIPYASRPDFFELENGKIYSLEEMGQKILNYMEETSYDYTANNAGGGGGVMDMAPDLQIVYIIIIAIIVGGIIFIMTGKNRLVK